MTKATFLKISYVYTDAQNQTIATSLLFMEAYATLAECCSLARFSLFDIPLKVCILDQRKFQLR